MITSDLFDTSPKPPRPDPATDALSLKDGPRYRGWIDIFYMVSSHDSASRGFWGRSSSSQKRRRAQRELSTSALLAAAAIGGTSAGASQAGITRVTGGKPS